MRRPPYPTRFPYTTLFRSPTTTAKFSATGLPRRSSSHEPMGQGESPSAPSSTVVMPCAICVVASGSRSEEHTSELQSLRHLVCRLLLEKKNRVDLPVRLAT